MTQKTAEELSARDAESARWQADALARAERRRRNPEIPGWLRSMDEEPPALRAAQAEGRLLDRGKWGFMIYRGACYADAERWARYRAALEELWGESWRWFDESMVERGLETGVVTERVKGRMALTWIEDETLEGKVIEEIRVRFKALRDATRDMNCEEPWMLDDLPIPYRMNHDDCLYVDEDCVSSLIGPPFKQETGTEIPSHGKSRKIAYILAVDGHYDSTKTWYPRGYEGYVKIKAGCLFSELTPLYVRISVPVSLDSIYSEAHEPSRLPSNGIWQG